MPNNLSPDPVEETGQSILPIPVPSLSKGCPSMSGINSARPEPVEETISQMLFDRQIRHSCGGRNPKGQGGRLEPAPAKTGDGGENPPHPCPELVEGLYIDVGYNPARPEPVLNLPERIAENLLKKNALGRAGESMPVLSQRMPPCMLGMLGAC